MCNEWQGILDLEMEKKKMDMYKMANLMLLYVNYTHEDEELLLEATGYALAISYRVYLHLRPCYIISGLSTCCILYCDLSIFFYS